jgi:CBS domain-containing protein
MLKAYEVMTRALAICTPETTITQAAAIMRDRDIGNVLVVDDGKLRGILTDRDLAINALTGEVDPLQTPISRYMSQHVVTGHADWSLDQVAKVMGKYQIRRLPIVQDGQLVGIISLGDVALFADRKEVVNQSLQAISAPVGISSGRPAGPAGAWIGVSLAALMTTLIAWLTWNQSGRMAVKRIGKSRPFHTLLQAVSQARDTAEEVASSKVVNDFGRQLVKTELYQTARDAVDGVYEKVDKALSGKSATEMRHQLRSNLSALSAQLSTGK